MDTAESPAPAERPPDARTRHYLSVESFQILASGRGSADITAELWRTERSRRLLMLVAVLDECDDDPKLLGPLPEAAHARLMIGTVQRTRNECLDSVLMHPQVGSWGAYALRRLRGFASHDDPLWIDFGLVHSLALVAAARAGLSWRTRLPVRQGTVLLPTLGVAHFDVDESAAVAQAQTDGGEIHLMVGDQRVDVPAEPVDAPGWWAMRRVRVGTEQILDVCLDDLDPYRDLADPVPPRRLAADELARWRRLIEDAWELLCRDHRDDAEAIAAGLRSIAPLASDGGSSTRSASTGEAFGGIMLSEPPDAVTMAVTLVHEYQHTKLGALMHLVKLSREDGHLFRAPWRDDPRPLSGLLHGIVAFVGIAAFFRRQSMSNVDSEAMTLEYAYARIQVDEALQAARFAPGLTDAGVTLIEALIARCGRWMEEPVAVEATRLAQLMADSHRLIWLLRHRHYASEAIVRLANAWLDRNPPGVSPLGTVTPEEATVWPHRLPYLARRWVLPSRETRNVADREVDRAEDALIAGEYDAARDAFAKLIATGLDGPDEVEQVRAWAGLGLAVRRCNGHDSALTTRPDLVHRTYEALVAMGHRPDPVELDAWLSTPAPAHAG
jgi:HEXXH motif-containing protein